MSHRPKYKGLWKRIKGSKPRRWRRIWRRNLTPIIPKSQWGGRAGSVDSIPGAWRGNVTMVVHHTVTPKAKAMTKAAGRAAVQTVDRVHSGNRGGIGYHYLASGGYLFEGRGFEKVAAAAYDSDRGIGWNRGRYVHVSVPGDYSNSFIHHNDLHAIEDLIAHLGRSGVKVVRMVGHRDLMPTACPGNGGARSLKRHFGKLWKGRA